MWPTGKCPSCCGVNIPQTVITFEPAKPVLGIPEILSFSVLSFSLFQAFEMCKVNRFLGKKYGGENRTTHSFGQCRPVCLVRFFFAIISNSSWGITFAEGPNIYNLPHYLRNYELWRLRSWSNKDFCKSWLSLQLVLAFHLGYVVSSVKAVLKTIPGFLYVIFKVPRYRWNQEVQRQG